VPPEDVPRAAAPFGAPPLIKRSVLREQVRELLTERIMNGHYQPGEQLVETRIAAEIGTSQGPVREALRELESMGLVTHEPYRGTRVRDQKPRELLAVFPVREALETVAVRLAIPHLSRDASPLHERLDAMRAAARAGDRHAFVNSDAGFHDAIVEAAHNSWLSDAYGAISLDQHVFVMIARLNLDLAAVAESHVPLLQALEAGKLGQAVIEVRAHLAAFARQAKADERAGRSA
jgi:DNA-binding GntR family transcriptional regulator